MRRAPAWIAAVGVLLGGTTAAPPAQGATVWVTLAAGVPGNATPTSDAEFWFDTPHSPAQVAINEISGGVSATATTGGGMTFFGGAGTPVLLNLADGSAYVAGGSPPAAAKTAGAGGGSAASAAPAAGGKVPSDAALLGINVAEPGAAGTRALTATVTDSLGNPLGTGSLTIPDGGWWVLGLSPGAIMTPPPTDPPPATDPPPVVDPGPGTGGGDPPITPPISPNSGGGGNGPVATPEPSTFVLIGVGGFAIRLWRRARTAPNPV